MTQPLSTEVLSESTSLAVSNNNAFQNFMQIATQLAKSDMIPQGYKNKPENCIIALELSNRMNIPAFQVMQNMHVIQGRPSWSSSFIIACIHASGKFKGCLHFELNKEKTACRAYAIERETNQKVTGPTVTLEMARNEGWLTKNGSKWKTMPELMLRYRAAAFFGRLYCPEIMAGMLSTDEVQDIGQDEEKVVDLFTDEAIIPDEELKQEETQNEAEQSELLQLRSE